MATCVNSRGSPIIAPVTLAQQAGQCPKVVPRATSVIQDGTDGSPVTVSRVAPEHEAYLSAGIPLAESDLVVG